MLVEEKIKVSINNRNITWYKNKEYTIPNNKTLFVNVYDIPKGSHLLIHRKWDICKKVEKISVYDYYKRGDICEHYKFHSIFGKNGGNNKKQLTLFMENIDGYTTK